jgi:hypothetical protein
MTVATMYLLGHVVPGLSAIQALTPLVPLRVSMALGVVGIAGGVVYFAWGYGRVFVQRPWIGAAGGLAALASGLALWGLALIRVVAAFREGV